MNDEPKPIPNPLFPMARVTEAYERGETLPVLRVFLHDDGTSPPGTGEDGPTHTGTARVDYPYQVEQWVIDATKDLPHIVRIRCPELGREWRRNEEGKFEEVFDSQGTARAAMKRRLAFDMELMRVGCPIVQAAMGGDTTIPGRMPDTAWVLAPTPDMKVYEIEDDEQLERIIKTMTELEAARQQLLASVRKGTKQ